MSCIFQACTASVGVYVQPRWEYIPGVLVRSHATGLCRSNAFWGKVPCVDVMAKFVSFIGTLLCELRLSVRVEIYTLYLFLVDVTVVNSRRLFYISPRALERKGGGRICRDRLRHNNDRNLLSCNTMYASRCAQEAEYKKLGKL